MAYMKFKEFGGWSDKLEKTANYSTMPEAAYKLGGNFEDFMKYAGVYTSEFSIKGPIIGKDEENKKYDITNETITNFKSKIPNIKVTKTAQFASVSKEYNSDGVVNYKNGETQITNNQLKGFRNAVKEQIQNNGAVFAIIDMDTNNLNRNTYSLYANEDEMENCHAVTIIGWDDNYSKSNFLNDKQPKNDGAWIALNSWGEEWGNNGLFYISYDDAIVEKVMCGVIEAKSYSEEPSVKLTYSNIDGGVKVTITSNERLKKPDSSWNLKYEEYYKTTYSKVRTTATTLEKTFYFNVNNKTINLVDSACAQVTVAININSINEPQLGDINQDNKITITDLLLLKMHLISEDNKSLQLNEKQLAITDINKDEKVNITDLLFLKKKLLNK